MISVFLGPPGSGKGTQAKKFSAERGIPQLSTGDMLRQAIAAGTALGRSAQEFMARGALVPDEVVIGLIRERTQRPDCRPGFILDGFPRNVAQAQVLRAILAEKQTPLDAVLELSIDNAEIISRLASRRTCRGCGKVFPGTAPQCDSCGGELYQRDDDKEEVIARRLEVYAEQTAPIVSYYRQEGLLITISALGAVPDVTSHAIRALSQKLS